MLLFIVVMAATIWSCSGATGAIGATETAEVGGDSGNRSIPTSNNTDNPMKINSC